MPSVDITLGKEYNVVTDEITRTAISNIYSCVLTKMEKK